MWVASLLLMFFFFFLSFSVCLLGFQVKNVGLLENQERMSVDCFVCDVTRASSGGRSQSYDDAIQIVVTWSTRWSCRRNEWTHGNLVTTFADPSITVLPSFDRKKPNSARENRTEISLLRTFLAARTCNPMMWCAMCSVIVSYVANASCCVCESSAENIRIRNAILYAFCGHFYGIECNGLQRVSYLSIYRCKQDVNFGMVGRTPTELFVPREWRKCQKYWKTNGMITVCTEHVQPKTKLVSWESLSCSFWRCRKGTDEHGDGMHPILMKGRHINSLQYDFHHTTNVQLVELISNMCYRWQQWRE